jgi:hypothetical protein
MKAVRLLIGFALIAASGIFAAGCSSEPEVVEVTGTVTHNGKTVPGLELRFEPETGRPSWGLSDNKGRFKLWYEKDRDGAQVGMHTVWVKVHANSPKEESDVSARIKNTPGLAAILDKYGDRTKSPLKIPIKADTRDIEVKLD